jgi:hypothetical protein
MSKFIQGIVIVGIASMLGAIGAIAAPAASSPTCMTQDEARKAFPHDHIYWHGKEHCWDNIGKHGQKPAANETEVSAPPEINRLDEKPLSKPKSEVEKTREQVVIPPLPFIGNDLRHGLVWPVLAPPANGTPADIQQDDPSPSSVLEPKGDVVIGAPDAAPGSAEYLLEHCCWPPPADGIAADAKQDDPLTSPAPEPKEDVVIGASDAAPGSTEYLLEHCCWPPTSLDEVRESVPLPHMIIASTGACALAAGFWLFIHRRQQRRIWVTELDDNASGPHLAAPPMEDVDSVWDELQMERLIRYACLEHSEDVDDRDVSGHDGRGALRPRVPNTVRGDGHLQYLHRAVN